MVSCWFKPLCDSLRRTPLIVNHHGELDPISQRVLKKIVPRGRAKVVKTHTPIWRADARQHVVSSLSGGDLLNRIVSQSIAYAAEFASVATGGKCPMRFACVNTNWCNSIKATKRRKIGQSKTIFRHKIMRSYC
jgi:hypothetical protein